MGKFILIIGLMSAGCAFDPSGEAMPPGPDDDPIDEPTAPDAGVEADAEVTPPEPAPDAAVDEPDEPDDEPDEPDDGPGNSGPGGGGFGGH